MSNPLVISISVSVQPDLTWYVYVTGNVVPRGNEFIQQLPHSITSLKAILSAVESAQLCPGNPEQHFVEIMH